MCAVSVVQTLYSIFRARTRGVGVSSPTKDLSGFVHISLTSFILIALGPCLGKPPLHMDLLLDIWMTSGT